MQSKSTSGPQARVHKLVGELATEAFSFLKEIEYWRDRFNETTAALRLIGYHQAGEIQGVHRHEVWVRSGDDGPGDHHISAQDFIDELIDGPAPLSPYYNREPKEEKEQRNKELSRKASKRDRRLAVLGPECNWTCVYCAKTGTTSTGPDGRLWHVDHIYPQSLGGDSKSDNLCLSCATCNLAKSDDLASKILSATLRKVVA